MEDVKGKELVDDTPPPVEQNDNKNETEIHKQPSSESEENAIKKKYGGLLPKKIPLISKPTPHQQPRARRMALSSGDNSEDAEADTNEPLDDQQASASAADNAKDDGGFVDAADAKDNIKS
ncbi:hypothetical protein F2Q70_00045141 [Brassica cretica]|uniref:Uncharacterized protein n=1 Tax=Brassica cretica TaxID=69181 RepID=A0A8S9KNN3_BRACR|nr:hypothetical protein F2Q70_00045141 [Brassica cretica]